MTNFPISLQDISGNLRFNNHIISLTRKADKFYWKYNPFKHFSLDVIRDTLILESSLFNTPSERSLRQTIINLTAMPLHAVFNIPMVNYDTDQLITSPRLTRYCEAPVTLIIQMMSLAIASNKNARLSLKTRLLGLSTIPEAFVFYQRKIRESHCGTMLLEPQLELTDNKLFLKEYPCFTETFLDLEWLNTNDGIQFIADFLNRLAQIDHSYIKMETYTDKSIPLYNSGTKTTLCSFVSQYDDGIDQTVGLLNGHTINFDNKELGVLISLASTLCPQIYDVNNNLVNFVGQPQFDILVTSNLLVDLTVLTCTTHSSVSTSVTDETDNNAKIGTNTKSSRGKSKRRINLDFTAAKREIVEQRRAQDSQNYDE
jgi:hypothetical protein